MPAQRLQQLMALLESNPGDSFLTFAIAKEYEGMGDLEKALEYYLALTGRDPGYVGAYYHLGKLYEQLGKADQALLTYGQGMEKARKAGDQHALNELAAAKLDLGDETG